MSIEDLQKLREPFPENQISKLPKPTKIQTDDVKADFKKGIRCNICGGWHHPKVIHLDYVGHAALTDRLLDTDPSWNWEPLSLTENGLPIYDSIGGLWIKLTVCGVTRLGYGSADDKKGGNAIKEVIGDALRNAAMRFGAALDLWHKGELHSEEVGEIAKPQPKPMSLAEAKRILGDTADNVFTHYNNGDQLGMKEIMDEMKPKEKIALKRIYTHQDNNIFDEIMKVYNGE